MRTESVVAVTIMRALSVSCGSVSLESVLAGNLRERGSEVSQK